MTTPTFPIGAVVRTPHATGTVKAWQPAGVCANWCSHHVFVQTPESVHTKWHCPELLALASAVVRVSELAPGDAFAALPTRTHWTLERHVGAVSWAVRHAPDEERRAGGPVGHGERDRFAPDALVQRGHT